MGKVILDAKLIDGEIYIRAKDYVQLLKNNEKDNEGWFGFETTAQEIFRTLREQLELKLYGR